MTGEKRLSDILKRLDDHEKRLSAIEGKKSVIKVEKGKSWYRQGSTSEKVVNLINQGIFDTPYSISSIISELETRDYHLKPADLTLPLRTIVRKGLLKRTKKAADGSISKKWLYVKA